MLPLQFPLLVNVTVAVHATVTVVIVVVDFFRSPSFLLFNVLVAVVVVVSIADALDRFRWPLLLIVYRCRLLLSFIAYRCCFPLSLLLPFPPLLLCGNSRGA